MDKANNLYDSISPNTEGKFDDYMNKLDSLAQNYIDSLEPYAKSYADDVGSCLK